MKYFFTKLILFSLLLVSVVQAQEPANARVLITGSVKDDMGKAIESATVALKGRGITAKTDRSGKFSLPVPLGSQTLIASYLGFINEELEIVVNEGENKAVDIVLQKSSSKLDEVIVSASRRVESLAQTPSSVTVLNAKDIESLSAVSPNFGNILGYAVPGLGTGTNNTGNYGQTLRGRNVLVFIDGIPQTAPLKSAGREIRSIDPSVIERVEVIKGATAIYGNGADGGLINYITKKANTGKPIGGYSQIGLSGNTEGYRTTGYRFNQQLYGKEKKFD